ncbi:Fc.00g111590.m01.CDS01 [Cosmosporella sp. VM-42]
MSSSLQRSRSLRKPSPSTTVTDPASKRPDAEPRHGSPSRLPVKPLTRSTRSSSIATSSTSTSTRTLRSSAAASGGLGRSASVRQPAAGNEPVKKEASRYPPSTTTTRPRARPAARPTSSDGPASQTRRVASHTRAKSTTTGLKSVPVLRPPSQGSSATTARTRTSRASSPEEKPGAPAQAHPRLRPAFSTLQQHYSPAKSSAPKPLTSTFLAPPSPSKLPANVAASAETSKLQTELLQLHLMHRDAAVVDAEWRASAKQKLGERFSKLAIASQDVHQRERAELERENVLALRSWAAGGGLEERIQALDGIVSGLWTLGESAGRYARVVRRFERWVDRLCEVEDARTGPGLLLQEQDVLFIGELDSAWKVECAGLRRRLDGWKRQLREIGQGLDDGGEERSSLKRMIEGSQIMIEDMLEELDVMEDIEREALAREDEWIERMNREDADDDTPRAGAIWRVV